VSDDTPKTLPLPNAERRPPNATLFRYFPSAIPVSIVFFSFDGDADDEEHTIITKDTPKGR
jgi:hypothetical protein